MTPIYDVKITLVSQDRKCPNGHCIGDTFIVGRQTPGGMCLGAFGALLPFITTLRFGGRFPWEKGEGAGHFACPDPLVRNVFRIERVPAPADPPDGERP